VAHFLEFIHHETKTVMQLIPCFAEQNKIVCVSQNVVAASQSGFVEIGEHEIGKQWRERHALSKAHASMDAQFLQPAPVHFCLRPHFAVNRIAKERNQAVPSQAPLDQILQLGAVNPIKEALYVCL
jgi:hypothetical protein